MIEVGRNSDGSFVIGIDLMLEDYWGWVSNGSIDQTIEAEPKLFKKIFGSFLGIKKGKKREIRIVVKAYDIKRN